MTAIKTGCANKVLLLFYSRKNARDKCNHVGLLIAELTFYHFFFKRYEREDGLTLKLNSPLD